MISKFYSPFFHILIALTVQSVSGQVDPFQDFRIVRMRFLYSIDHFHDVFTQKDGSDLGAFAKVIHCATRPQHDGFVVQEAHNNLRRNDPLAILHRKDSNLVNTFYINNYNNSNYNINTKLICF